MKTRNYERTRASYTLYTNEAYNIKIEQVLLLLIKAKLSCKCEI